ncbi:MAG: transglutaminase-like putative cysteine protease [Candidatus Krumholzibacteriia bacterium]|jgi:transglutaminase-like putative cysteine protease
MKRATTIVWLALVGCILMQSTASIADPDSRVTQDIAEGIDAHIIDEVAKGGGYFHLQHGDLDLKLKLVRIHMEFLSNLGPQSHFACVDLADVSGDVYDVDFFLTGDPGNMKVTETTVHKINGIPYYVWDQDKDKNWHRMAVDRASEGHFGVMRGKDSFEFVYNAVLPEMDNSARMWLPLPESDAFQEVKVVSIEAPGKRKELRDEEFGNRVLFLELEPADSGKTVEIRFQVDRLEKAAYEADIAGTKRYLDPDRLVPANDDFRTIAKEVVEGKRSDLVRARALYDHVLDTMSYKKYGEGWGKGDAVYACDIKSGNCTDFHSYFIALARSVGIPARFMIGAGIPSDRDYGGVDGYHCWAEFYADGKWWPVDISEGDKYSSLATYYFGHHPANRFTLTYGRDIVVDPLPESGAINFLAYPVLEVGGESARAAVKFSFVRGTVQ